MSAFQFSAVDEQGTTIEGTLRAEHVDLVGGLLRQRGLICEASTTCPTTIVPSSRYPIP